MPTRVDGALIPTFGVVREHLREHQVEPQIDVDAVPLGRNRRKPRPGAKAHRAVMAIGFPQAAPRRLDRAAAAAVEPVGVHGAGDIAPMHAPALRGADGAVHRRVAERLGKRTTQHLAGGGKRGDDLAQVVAEECLRVFAVGPARCRSDARRHGGVRARLRGHQRADRRPSRGSVAECRPHPDAQHRVARALGSAQGIGGRHIAQSHRANASLGVLCYSRGVRPLLERGRTMRCGTGAGELGFDRFFAARQRSQHPTRSLYGAASHCGLRRVGRADGLARTAPQLRLDPIDPRGPFAQRLRLGRRRVVLHTRLLGSLRPSVQRREGTGKARRGRGSDPWPGAGLSSKRCSTPARGPARG